MLQNTFVDEDTLVCVYGVVSKINSSIVAVRGLSKVSRVGDLIGIGKGASVFAEVMEISNSELLAKPFDDHAELKVGDICQVLREDKVGLARLLKGRVLDAFGRPVGDRGPLIIRPTANGSVCSGQSLLSRDLVRRPVVTGVRAVDLFFPICYGQRIGVFAGSGVGKSTLVGMLAESAGFDSIVVGLIGERSREVREFVEVSLGKNFERSIVVVSTSAESAMRRRAAATTATAIAESLRDRGEAVLLVIDSITRFAHALRDISLAGGELPVSRGYPASVMSALPKLLERAGPGYGSGGSITAIYSVLVDGDDHNDPIADSVRGTLDGHIVLSREIASRGQFPAIDLLQSLSRLAHFSWTNDQQKFVQQLRRLVTLYEETRDIRSLSTNHADVGSDLELALKIVPQLYKALQQSPGDSATSDVFGYIAKHLREVDMT